MFKYISVACTGGKGGGGREQLPPPPSNLDTAKTSGRKIGKNGKKTYIYIRWFFWSPPKKTLCTPQLYIKSKPNNLIFQNRSCFFNYNIEKNYKSAKLNCNKQKTYNIEKKVQKKIHISAMHYFFHQVKKVDKSKKTDNCFFVLKMTFHWPEIQKSWTI